MINVIHYHPKDFQQFSKSHFQTHLTMIHQVYLFFFMVLELEHLIHLMNYEEFENVLKTKSHILKAKRQFRFQNSIKVLNVLEHYSWKKVLKELEHY